MIFVIETVESFKSTSKSLDLIPMIETIQLPNAVATKSVGEKASPLPWLSVGASVRISVPDCKCIQTVLNSPT